VGRDDPTGAATGDQVEPVKRSADSFMKKQIALLGIILLISAAYAVSAARRIGFWAGILFVIVWVAVFSWARSRKKS